MSPILPLPASALYTRCEPTSFQFKTSAEIAGLDGLWGQEIALEALHFGLAVRREGYNVYALGTEGLGKHWTILKELEQRAAAEPVPFDWCYVHNFDRPHRPHALRLPPGRGAALRDEVDTFVERLRVILPAAFESDEYRARLQELAGVHEARREAAFAEFKKRAEEHDVTLLRTPSGLALAPIRSGEVLAPDEFHKLPEAEQVRISAELLTLVSALSKVPLKQGLAVTGSVNQRGQIQAIGAVNEKIEGFFDVCQSGGLTGAEGVLIPESNVKHLMLRRDVQEAVAAGQFRVYPIATIDEAIELLTGVPAGERSELGFPEGSVNRRVEARLIELANRARAFTGPARTPNG